MVGVFQQFTEALFECLPNASHFKRSKNTFQRLQESSTLWKDATGKGYKDILSNTKMRDLGSMFRQYCKNCVNLRSSREHFEIYTQFGIPPIFQMRHLLAHRNGIVDQEYIDKSCDNSYTIGQRLVIKESVVLRPIELLNKLGQDLRALV